MCGIVGIYRLNGAAIEPPALQRMVKAVKHRGPDDEGYIFINTKSGELEEKKGEGTMDGIEIVNINQQLRFGTNIALGNCRLSIIDLSINGHQPMHNEDRSIWIVSNGEIYNYKELKTQLENCGHKFYSMTDTEVIIHSYEEWGTDCLLRFNGMWAFAIWDQNRRELFISRDRFGIKPLYYFFDTKRFIFASEIKAILEVLPEERSPDYTHLCYFLKTGTQDNSEETFFKNIKSLKPAHSLIIDESGLKIWRYWDIQPILLEDKNHTEKFLELFKDSINLRLRSDVPIGTCLSGGIDSSSIVLLESMILDNPINTFSAVWQDRECDESYFIKIVTEENRTNAYFIEPKAEDLFDILPRIVWHQDSPSTGPGLYPQWWVMRLAQGKVKVLLDGQGGDELLGGYFRYFFPYLMTLIKKGHFVRFLREQNKISNLIGASVAKGLLRAIFPYAYSILDSIRGKGNRSIFNSDFWYAYSTNSKRDEKIFSNDLNNTSYWDLVRYSLPALLHYEDRNSMAFGIEARTPFLDYRLVELCMSLPFDEKIKGDTTKYILRKAMKGLLPEEIRNRKDKKGYPTPVAKWFRGILKSEVEDIIFSPSFKGRKIFDEKEIRNRFDLHCSGKRDYSWDIWRWITTELWFREFIDCG